MVNEFSGLYYNDCHETSYMGGEEVYESFDKRLEWAGEAARQMIWGLREIETASLTPWNIVWYSMYPLPNKRIFLNWKDLDTPGIKPDSINPYSVTLNYGFDKGLPEYEPNPAYEKIKSAYPAIAAHIDENDSRFYSKETVQRTLYIFNDIQEKSDITLQWSLSLKNKVIQSGKNNILMTPYETKQETLEFITPEVNQREKVDLEITILKEKKVVFKDSYAFSIFPQIKHTKEEWAKLGRIALYDELGETDNVFKKWELPFSRLTKIEEFDPNSCDILIIGSGSLQSTPLIDFLQSSTIRTFVNNGGDLLSLEHSFKNDPESYINTLDKPVKYAHPGVHSNPILKDTHPTDFQNWRSDEIIAQKLYPRPFTGNVHSILDVGDRDVGLTYSPLLEIYQGKGKVILNQLDLINKIWKEPIAEKILVNILSSFEIKQTNSPKKMYLVSDSSSPFTNYLKQIGFKEPALRDLTEFSAKTNAVIVIDGKSTTFLKDIDKQKINLKSILENGDTLWIQELSPETIDKFSDFFGFKIKLHESKEQNLVKVENNTLFGGLNNSDFCWANGGGGEDISDYTLDIDSSVNPEPLLKTVAVKWAGYAGWGEQYKVGKMMKIISEFPGTQYPMVKVDIGKGQIIFSQIRFDKPVKFENRSSRILNVMLTNLGVSLPEKMNPLLNRHSAMIDEKGYILGWLMLGPYKNPDTNTLLTKNYIGEEGWGQPQENMITAGKKWMKYFSKSPKINLEDTTLFGPQENSVAYAHIYIYSPLKRDILLESPDLVRLRLGSDDGIKVWVNSAMLLEDEGTGAHKFDQYTLGPIKLVKGWNRLLLKISQRTGAWGFSARFTYDSKLPVSDLRYSLNPPN